MCELAKQAGAFNAVPCYHWSIGGKGSVDLAQAVREAASKKSRFQFLYDVQVRSSTIIMVPDGSGTLTVCQASAESFTWVVTTALQKKPKVKEVKPSDEVLLPRGPSSLPPSLCSTLSAEGFWSTGFNRVCTGTRLLSNFIRHGISRAVFSLSVSAIAHLHHGFLELCLVYFLNFLNCGKIHHNIKLTIFTIFR